MNKQGKLLVGLMVTIWAGIGLWILSTVDVWGRVQDLWSAAMG